MLIFGKMQEGNGYCYESASAPPAHIEDAPIIQAFIPRLNEGSSLRQRLLLQIEDNEANAELLKQIIARRNDLTLLTATDGYQGIEMASIRQPDVIVTDMKMPGMNGLEVLAHLRNNAATAHIPVIVVSSNAYKSEIEHCLNAGCFRYVTKPFNIVELMAVIDSALDYGDVVRLAK